MTPRTYLIVNAIVFAGFLVRAFTGFGAVIFILPLLALLLPVKIVVPLLAVLGLATGGWLAYRSHGHVDRPEMRALVIGALPGMLLGLLLVSVLTDHRLRQVLGLLLVGVGLWLAWERRTQLPPLPRSIGLGAGFASGFLGALFGLSGPPSVSYLARQRLSSASFRATLLVFILVVDALRAVGYYISGAIDGGVCWAGAGLLPAALAGSWCGERFQSRVSERAFRQALAALLVFTGILFFFR